MPPTQPRERGVNTKLSASVALLPRKFALRMRRSCLQLLTSCVQFSHDLFQDGYIFSFYQSARNENNNFKYVSVVMGTFIIV